MAKMLHFVNSHQFAEGSVAGNYPIQLHPATQHGDLLMLIAYSDNGSNGTMSASGWTKRIDNAYAGNSRAFIVTRTYNSSDSPYELNVTAAGYLMWVCVTIRGAKNNDVVDVGALGLRNTSPDLYYTPAPGMTLNAPGRTFLIGMERTFGVMTANTQGAPDFTRDAMLQGRAGGAETIFIGHKEIPDNTPIPYVLPPATVGPYTRSHGSNAGAVQIHIPWGDVDYDTAPPSEFLVFDDFNRDVPSGLGVPSIGRPYAYASGTTILSVSDGRGKSTPTLETKSSEILMIEDKRTTMDCKMDISLDQLPDTYLAYRLNPRRVDSLNFYSFYLNLNSSGLVTGRLISNNGTTEGYLTGEVPLAGTYTPGKTIRLRVKASGTFPTRIQAKYWYTDTNEPTDWNIDITDSGSNIQTAGGVSARFAFPSGETTLPIVSFDNFVMDDREGSGSGSSGLIPYMFAANPSSDGISVALFRPGTGAVSVILRNQAGLEIDRALATFDINGWGNAQFGGLSQNTNYIVTAEVNGVSQSDVTLSHKTLPTSPSTFKVVAGSCQFTASNHIAFQKILAENPLFLSHMGDLHYADATTESAWRTAMNNSLNAPRFKTLLQSVPIIWTMDNHDRIIKNLGGDPSLGLNMGATDPATQTAWRKLAGPDSWASSDTLGRTWTVGNVQFIQTDMWSVRDDPDFDSEPRTFLGDEQKAWFKQTLQNSTALCIVWLCSWTAKNHSNGRWNSFQAETLELEQWIDARPGIKNRMVMIGGDSHGVQGDDGSRAGNAGGYRFPGIPSLNISGFNRSTTTGDLSEGWSIINTSMRTAAQLENDLGGYSLLSFTETPNSVAFTWDAVRVQANGDSDVMATFSKTFVSGGSSSIRQLELIEYDGAIVTPLALIEGE